MKLFIQRFMQYFSCCIHCFLIQKKNIFCDLTSWFVTWFTPPPECRMWNLLPPYEYHNALSHRNLWSIPHCNKIHLCILIVQGIQYTVYGKHTLWVHKQNLRPGQKYEVSCAHEQSLNKTTCIFCQITLNANQNFHLGFSVTACVTITSHRLINAGQKGNKVENLWFRA